MRLPAEPIREISRILKVRGSAFPGAAHFFLVPADLRSVAYATGLSRLYPGPGTGPRRLHPVPDSERNSVNEERATRVVASLRDRGVFAHVERAGVYQFGVRVVLSDGREAVWDSDGASALEATVMRNGMLVGFVPTVPGSEDLDDAGVVDVIARADYDARP